MPFKKEPAFQHGQAERTAVLLCNLGTPDEPTAPALRRYLAEFLGDHRVVEIPRPIWWLILHGIILRTRPAKSARKYASIWTPEGSPLKVWTSRQATLLRGWLGERGHLLTVRYAMRYGNPSIASELDQLKAEGATRILIVPLYPQYSGTTTASVFDAVYTWAAQVRHLPELRFINRYHDDPAYIDALARSVPLDDLEVTVDELGAAFEGRGPQLQRLSDSLVRISDSGIRTMPQLQALIRDGATVLDTQADQSGEIVSFSRDLRTVTEALRDSDSDLERLITTGPEFADEARYLVENSGAPLTRAVGNLSATMKTVDPLAPSFKVLLQLLPALAAGGLSTAPGDGTLHFGLVLENDNPTPCTQGYEGTQRIIDEMKAQDPGFDPQEQNFPPNYEARCTVPLGSPTAVRGAERVEYAYPGVPQPWDTKPKIDPDRLNLSVAAEQLAALQGLIPR